MSKKKLEAHEITDANEATDTKEVPMDLFRVEAEEHAARAERERLEHRAAELGVTVAQLKAGIPPFQEVEDVPINDAHVRESIKASQKALKDADSKRA